MCQKSVEEARKQADLSNTSHLEWQSRADTERARHREVRLIQSYSHTCSLKFLSHCYLALRASQS